jgi:hypothetical protein
MTTCMTHHVYLIVQQNITQSQGVKLFTYFARWVKTELRVGVDELNMFSHYHMQN